MLVLLTTGNIHLALFENFWSMAHWAYQNTQNPENDHFWHISESQNYHFQGKFSDEVY